MQMDNPAIGWSCTYWSPYSGSALGRGFQPLP